MSGPAFLANNVIDGLQTAVATLEAIASQAQLSTTSAAAVTTQLATLYNSIPGRVSQDTGVDHTIASDLLAASQAIVSAMPAASAAMDFGAAYDAAAPQDLPATLTTNAAIDAENGATVFQLQRLALLAGYAQALLSMTFDSRQAGINARSAFVARMDVELSACSLTDNMPLYGVLQTLRGAVVSYLTKLITTLQPVVTVTTPRVSSVLWLSWRLYRDTSQAADILARNNIAHPSFCPRTLEVLAPGAA